MKVAGYGGEGGPGDRQLCFFSSYHDSRECKEMNAPQQQKGIKWGEDDIAE
jgi:hypothetical protein